jgi:integrase
VSILPLQTTAAAAASEAYRNFINTLDSEISKVNYLFGFSKFMTFCGVEDYDKMLQIESKKLEGLIRDYITHLRVDMKRSYNTVNLYVASISHFYQMNDVILNWKRLSKFKGKKRLVVEDKPYTKEQIRQLLDFADLRTKCVILLMSSAGLRRGAIPTLRKGDLKRMEKYGLYKILVYKNESESYETFCTPECAKHLDQYFEWRAVQGEKLSDTSPVIRNNFISLNVARVKAISTESINWLINSLLDKSGIRPRSPNNLHRTEMMQCHAFRKYFQTTAKLAGMDSLLIDRCMGHKTGLHDCYSKLDGDQTLEGNDKMIGYVGAIGDLSIDDSNSLRVKVTKLEQKEAELQDIKSQLNEFKKWKDDLMREVREIQDRSGAKQIQQDKEHEEYRVEWIRKENEQRKKLGLNLYDKDAFKQTQK